MSTWSVLVVLVVLLAPAVNVRSADSPTTGVVAVAPPPGPTPELVEMTGQLRLVLSKRSQGVLDAAALRDRMSGPSGASLSELDRAYEGALAAYLNGDYKGSVRTLRTIIEDLEKVPEGRQTFFQWTRAMLRLSSTELDLDRGDVANQVADRLVRADPGVQVDAAQYPPRLVRLIERARSKLRSSPVAKLSVRSGASARVFVDGREVGTTPLTVTLARGRYRVAGARQAIRAPAVQVDLTNEDQSVTLDFTVPETLRPDKGPGLALPDAERPRRLIAAGGFLRLDAILAMSLLDDAGASYLLGSLHDVRRGMLMREGRVRLSGRSLPRDGAASLADFLVTGKISSPVEPYPPIFAAAPGDEKSKALGWTAFGTGVAMVGLGGVAVWQAISSGNSYDSARNLLQPDSRVLPEDEAAYGRHLSAGDAANRRAIGIGIGAGVCAATTAILGYLAYRQTGEIGPFRF